MTKWSELETLLRTADSAPEVRGLDDWAVADLQRIISTPRQRDAHLAKEAPSLVSRGRLLLVAGIVLVLVSGGALVLPALQPWTGRGGSNAYAETPEPLQVLRAGPSSADPNHQTGAPARRALLDLAERIQNLPDEPTRRYARVELETWSLWVQVGENSTTSEVVPGERTTWLAPDGSGRTVSWTQQAGRRKDKEDESFGPGERPQQWPLGSLSPDVRELERQLAVGHPIENGPAERLVAVTDAYQEQPLRAAVRAAILRFLARTPGLTVAGEVLDRASRPGLAIYLDSDHGGLPNRLTLILDTNTGSLLGDEDTLTKTAGRLNVRIPSVTSYTTYRSSTWTDDLK